jgi:hypothetical protein
MPAQTFEPTPKTFGAAHQLSYRGDQNGRAVSHNIFFCQPPSNPQNSRVTEKFHPRDAKKFEAALLRFDTENSRDPNREDSQPRELLYAKRLTDWVLRLCPDAPEELRLAACCQHICRWEIPRADYPMTRAGYLKWRADLKKFHAQKSGEILQETGYDENVIRRVQDLNLKKNFPNDDETQVLEDALCLVFLEFQLADLAAKTAEDKTINALQKSWGKMSGAARAEALKLNYGMREKALLQRALNG